MVDQWGGHGVVQVEAVADGSRGVVCALHHWRTALVALPRVGVVARGHIVCAALFACASSRKALEHQLALDIEVDHHVDWAHFGDVVERLRLTYRARETVQNVATNTCIVFADAPLHEADHQFVVNEFASVKHFFDRSTNRGVFTDCCTQHFTR